MTDPFEGQSKTSFLASLDQAKAKAGTRLQKKIKGLELLLDISRHISTLQFPQVIETIMRHVLDLTGTRRGFLMLLENDQLQLKHAVHLNAEQIHGREFGYSRSLTWRAIEQEKVIVVEGIPREGPGQATSFFDLDLKALMVIPLKGQDRIRGVIYVDSDAHDHKLND